MNYIFIDIIKWNRDVSIGIETGNGLDGLGSIPSRGQYLSLLHSVQTDSGAQPAS
jgi:hypothetical protein